MAHSDSDRQTDLLHSLVNRTQIANENFHGCLELRLIATSRSLDVGTSVIKVAISEKCRYFSHFLVGAFLTICRDNLEMTSSMAFTSPFTSRCGIRNSIAVLAVSFRLDT